MLYTVKTRKISKIVKMVNGLNIEKKRINNFNILN